MRLTEIVTIIEIFKAGEITTALQQTKALRVFHGEALTAKCFGLFNGRQIHSPLPAWIERPLESCNSGR